MVTTAGNASGINDGAAAIVVMSADGAPQTVLLVPVSAWSDRIGRLLPMTLGWAMYAAMFALLALADAPWMFWAIAVMVGLYQALTEGAERALIADQVPAQQLGTAYGAYYLVKGLLLLPASLGFGLLVLSATSTRGLLGRWAVPGAGWAREGIATYAYDQRGFGRSPRRGSP